MKRMNLGWSLVGMLALSCGGTVMAQTDAPSAPPVPPAPTVPPAPAAGSEAPKAEYKGPTAKEIIERYLEVTGGRQAYQKITNREMTGTMEIPQVGVKGATHMISAAPNKMCMKVDLGGFGSQNVGTDGTIAWNVDTIQGARLLEGEEKAQILRQAKFNQELNWEEMYKEVTADSEQEIDGKPAYAVILVSTDGQKQTNFYDKESGLLVRTSTIAKNQMGDVPIDSIFSEFKEVDGVKMAHKTVISSAMGMQIIMTIESVKQNTELPPETFAVPEEVKKALEAPKPAEAPAGGEPKKE